MKNDKERSISTRFTYLITFLLGAAFCITLVQSAWKTAIERKQKDFQFEIVSIEQSVARNVLTGNDVTNNVASFIYANDSTVFNGNNLVAFTSTSLPGSKSYSGAETNVSITKFSKLLHIIMNL